MCARVEYPPQDSSNNARHKLQLWEMGKEPTSNDLLVLCVVRVCQHLSCLFCPAACHEETHSDAGCLSCHCAVCVQHILQVLPNFLVL